VEHQNAFASPLDDELVSLSIASRLVLNYVHSREYIDPDEPLAPALASTARRIADLVPLSPPRPFVEGADLSQWAIRRGDLRTALQRLGQGTHDRRGSIRIDRAA
jgi:hypothetical protein